MEAITINTEKLFDLDNINFFAKEWKEAARGNKVLAYYCSHMPEEILYAADILPYRLSGTGVTDDSQAETYMSPFSCSFCRACFQKFLDGSYDFLDGFVASDGCLQPQRVFDNPKDELLEKANVEVIARFPEDPILNKFDREGRSLLELPDESGCVLEARRLVEEILA